ncbi:FimV/HubP family polar landmark protein [Undibacterium sp.]|uniref:FimV/HubP family polar landmark protein n=1 Tax=Undibacterium sp. TaxID=1914977 RepID=UPI002B9D5AB5|nr:FimV/HubP family polar landmark protein [Undibacterium sp.]HTD04905.1 FimV/HubP family polar landmark protein [Undibacterium sp.]
MHNYKRSPSMLLGRKALGAAVASALLLLATGANATGLGRLTVLSALGQPLRAEIELTSPSKEDIGSLVPKLASADAFKQANIDFNPALTSLRFVVEPRGPGYVIRVSSSQAMNEPFVDLLLELNSSNGKLLREYTFLLDPADLRNSQSAQVANPVSIATPSSQAPSPQTQAQAQTQARPSAPPPVSAPVAPTRRPASRPQETAAAAKPAGDYQVKSGDTLSKIAGAYKPDGVSLDQMLVSLYRANPQAFAGNNMNRLKAGQILTVPDADTARSAGSGEAHSVVMAHAADFSAYRNKLAGQVARAPAEKATATRQGASGSITAKVKELPTATNEAADKLKLSKANPDAAGAVKAGTGKPLAEEDKLAKDKAIADANTRVKELEKNVGDLQKILEVKDKDLAAKQAAANAKPEVKAETQPAAAPASKPAAVAATAAAPASASAAAAANASVVASAKTAPKHKVLPPPPPPEPGFFDGLMDNPLMLPFAGIVVALLGAYGIFTSRRKKKLQQFEDSILTGSSMKANSMFGSTGGQSVDTNNSVFNSNFAPSASQLDANEVDPVAEADVYIAYGRDSQAEEILKEALRTQPDRHAVRVKLLEIYSNRKDTKSFERLASELYGMTGGKGEEWAQAASMGIMLEPGNPLYAGGKASDALSTAAALGSSTQPLEDLDPEALLANSLSQDMLESISIIDTASAKAGEHGSEDATKHLDAGHAMDIGPLDFDLDIPTGSAPEAHAPHVAPHIPLEEAPLIPESSAAPLAKAEDRHEEQNSLLDFESIDFDLGTEEPAKAAHAAEAHLDIPESKPLHEHADMLDHAENSLNMEPFELAPALHHGNEIAFESAAPVAHEVPAHVPNIMDDIPDLPSLDHSMSHGHHDEAPKAEVPANYDFDLSGIDLNLDAEEHKPAGVAEHDGHAYNAEMATKLDLAVAYHEIGDKEGARELLDEVLKGGTADQIHKAHAMLAQLG